MKRVCASAVQQTRRRTPVQVNCKEKNCTEMRRTMSKGWKGKIALALCVILTAGTLGGCGKQRNESSGAGQEASEAGRYVERILEKPAEWQDSDLMQIFEAEGKMHLLLRNKQEQGSSLEEWVLQEDGTFEQVTQSWLQELGMTLPENSSSQLMQDGEGNQYLYALFTDEADGEYKGHLWRGKDAQMTDITPEKWRTVNEEYGFFVSASALAMTGQGTIISVFFDAIDVFLAEDGSLVKTQVPQQNYGDTILTAGDKCYLPVMDNMGTISGLECWDVNLSGETQMIPFSQENSTSQTYFSILADGAIVAANADGFFQCDAGDTNWRKILDGADTSFSLVSSWCRGMAAPEGGVYYAAFQNDDGSFDIMEYAYDPDAVVEVTQELTLYTVSESFLLQQAAAMYHREHPEVMIHIESALSKVESYRAEVDYNQIYQNLNTEMLAGNAADILILDNLKADSYAEKGLLVDIQDVIEPLEQSGELLANITEGYVTTDGKRYTVPLQFGMTLAAGRELPEEAMASMEALARFLEGKEESFMGDKTPGELVDLFYSYFVEEIVQGKELNREALSARLLQLKTIADNCGIITKREKDDYGYRIWDLPSKVKIVLSTVRGFNDAMLPLSVVDMVEGSYIGFESAYIPIMEVGIYSRSEHIETAKDFLRFALSEPIQDTDYYEGFPINSKSLEKQIQSDRSNAEAYTSIEVADGVFEEFTIKQFSSEDAQKLAKLCNSLHVAAGMDLQIKSVLAENLPAYLDGSQSLEATVDMIEGGLKMYLAE